MPINNSPTAPLVGGTSSRDPILSGYVFQSGIHKPEHSSILTYKYPQYYMTTMLDRLGASEGKGQDLFSWNIQDRTRQSATLSTITSGGTTGDAVGVWTTNVAVTATDLGYFLVNDVVRLPSGDLARITASADTGGFQAITVVKVGTGNWSVTVAVTNKIGHAFSAFPEASSAPTGRLYLPTEDYNVMTINRRSFKISGSEFTNRTYLGDGSSWYFTIEDIEMKEFAKDNEHIVVFGELDSTSTNKVSRGVLDWAVADGVNNGFVGATGVSEADLRNHIKELMLQGVSNEIYVLCGSQFLADVQVALIDYAIDGALNYGSFGNNTAGLDFQSYKFLGKTVNFMYYELFDDDAIVPDPGAATASVIDFTNFSLWLDLGSTSNGQKLISLCHKELDGQSRKYIHAYEIGMMNPDGTNGGNVANGDDAFTIHYLSEISVKVLNPERLGILRATS
jgi:hypothetical protein